MSIFASRAQKTIELPFDAPHTVTIQKLAGRHLEKARQESLFQSVDYVKRIGGLAFQKELAAATGGDDAEKKRAVEDAQQDPLTSVDVRTVLQFGIKAWSYDQAVTTEAVEDLTDEAAEFLAREILRFTKPALFDAEAAEKNG